MKNWLYQKLVAPLIQLLKQGVTVETLAWSLAAGIVCCCFPVLGATSILCFIVAVVFRLNHVAIQLANYACYPLQILLIIPFLQMGNKIFGYESLDFNLEAMSVEFQIDAWTFFEKYIDVAGRAIVAWALVAPFALVLLYFGLRPLVGRIMSLRKLQS